jgi:hypothetical protein
MAKYVVFYEMRKGGASSSGSIIVECETEKTAVRITEDKAKSQKPGYEFILKKIEKK